MGPPPSSPAYLVAKYRVELHFSLRFILSFNYKVHAVSPVITTLSPGLVLYIECSPYCAATGGLPMLMRTIAVELAPHGT
jgi:NAD(P)-dependent dehydrogenase (short-subunit alcohol dehydrogenase family)